MISQSTDLPFVSRGSHNLQRAHFVRQTLHHTILRSKLCLQKTSANTSHSSLVMVCVLA